MSSSSAASASSDAPSPTPSAQQTAISPSFLPRFETSLGTVNAIGPSLPAWLKERMLYDLLHRREPLNPTATSAASIVDAAESSEFDSHTFAFTRHIEFQVKAPKAFKRRGLPQFRTPEPTEPERFSLVQVNRTQRYIRMLADKRDYHASQYQWHILHLDDLQGFFVMWESTHLHMYTKNDNADTNNNNSNANPYNNPNAAVDTVWAFDSRSELDVFRAMMLEMGVQTGGWAPDAATVLADANSIDDATAAASRVARRGRRRLSSSSTESSDSSSSDSDSSRSSARSISPSYRFAPKVMPAQRDAQCAAPQVPAKAPAKAKDITERN